MIAAALLTMMIDDASADLWRGVEYGFVDRIGVDTGVRPLGWDLDATAINQDHPLVYQHDLTVYGVPDKRQVADAWLELSFANDFADDEGSMFWGLIKWDHRESAALFFDGEEWKDIGEVDSGSDVLSLNVDWLNDNGVLDVAISVSNPLGTAIAWLDHSVLYGNLVHMPVPGAVLLGFLGLGYAGMRLREFA